MAMNMHCQLVFVFLGHIGLYSPKLMNYKRTMYVCILMAAEVYCVMLINRLLNLYPCHHYKLCLRL